MPNEPKLGIGRGMISLTPEQVVDIRVNGGEDPALVMASVRQAMEMGKTTFEIQRWEWRDMLGSVPPGKFVSDWWKNLGELRHAPKSLLQLGQEIAGFAVDDFSDFYRNLTPDELKSFQSGEIIHDRRRTLSKPTGWNRRGCSIKDRSRRSIRE